MNILLCGASGFIGQAMGQALTDAGHHVVATRSASAKRGATPGSIAVDYALDTITEV